MKLSKETMEVLKNFASINQSVILKPGTKQRTHTPQKNLVAYANVAEDFPEEAPIYDLNQFLATASLFSDADYEFSDKFVTIDGDATVKYVYAAKEALSFTDKEIKFPSRDEEFDLPWATLSAAIKAAGVMGLSNVLISGSDKGVFISAVDPRDEDANSWKKKIADESENSFKIYLRVDLFKLLPRDYHVTVSKQKLIEFAAKDVTYYMASETNSTFG